MITLGHIVLIVTIGFALVLLIIALKRAKKEAHIILSKRNIPYILVFGILIMVYLLLNLTKIKPADWAQILLVLGLVGVTGLYVWSTAKQAHVSEKMAEEVREQRYDAVLPVIDFERMELEPVRISAEGVTTKKEEEIIYSLGLQCVLRNIGIGPATDVYSFTLTVSGERRWLDFGILTIKGEPTPQVLLSPEQRGDRWFLVAYYRDVYSRCFESSREVSVDKERSAWSTGPLKFRKIAEEELPK